MKNERTTQLWVPILEKKWFGLWKILKWKNYSFVGGKHYLNGVLQNKGGKNAK